MTSTLLRTLAAVVLLAAAQPTLAVTLKIATLSPDGSYWMQKMRSGGDDIEKQTQGRVSFKFYPGGVMGDDTTVLRKMRLNQLQGAAITGGALNTFYPDIQLYNQILLFRNTQEVDQVRQQFDGELLQGLEQHGIVGLGFAEVGFAYLMSTVPVQSLADMRSQKTWAPADNTIAVSALQALGITPTPLPLRDVLMGLQTGMINVVAGSPVGALALQWHSKIKYITDLPMLYVFGVLAVDKKAFDEITPEDRQIVHTVMAGVIKEIDRHSRQDNQDALKALQNQSIQMVKPTQADVDELKQTLAKTAADFEKAAGFSAEKTGRLNALLATLRGASPQ
ncbi:MAG: TRAP transporter substrate-binding protein DctP [Methylomonas sp.]|nr:TRAP transporter substrate-binding protein DctP [Methylomonas sp.]PPD22595.1 MAG: C4-dicarboxylate ABC transporter [Methylomonas sp.]PPD27905.1 MAG: C4-dicarboxylate ABC transporter [Methylomonas sp.]PPD40015.1 MAG: C4-dicarboxylate ABC transporter [Methylomonas sp.]PPD41597.1 MAG: C4-dicarboxylate ABC transporter [Methylomonas sp.]